jgi:hypothetical protein
MILVGPTAVNTQPAFTQPNVLVPAVVVDLVKHTAAIQYGQRALAVALTPQVQLALEAFIQATIEQDQGWAPGSSAIVQP